MVLTTQRVLVLSLLSTLACQNSHAFIPSTLSRSGRASVSPFATTMHAAKESNNDLDLSIEYDAAAKLAYNEWLTQYEKGEFDEVRYQSFRSNYEALSIANVIASKKARDENNSDELQKLTLNEYADYTVEEYLAMQNGTPEESSKIDDAIDNDSKGILDVAMESSAAQSEASVAISEAADALAEEEKVRFI